ncbi:MAG: glyoxylate/hydroxypyruvate reductase A [Desulfuromusa sp.]|jgi:glyoxylate/hydroxypyruvate reductase A|nr:glyoxylate/hydroxypyruvate reductase A [Desulfuromusa sp.]
MSIAIIYPNQDISDWLAALRTHEPALKIEVWPEITEPEKVEFALCWNQPAGCLQQLTNVKCISSLGAGVNHLLNDVTRPLDVPIVRLVDDNLKQSMAEYVMLGVLEHFRRLKDYRFLQAEKKWRELQIPHISELGVGIMGCGAIGRYVANKLIDFGFSVHGWSRTRKDQERFPVYAGNDELEPFLSQTDILVCLLPLTPETKNILNLKTFNQLPAGAYLINVGRGSHLVENDLLSALDSGQLSGALLDVFREEPLPELHPFWDHSKVSITPHIASVTNPLSAAEQIVENYRRVVSGEPFLNLVDVKCGY